MNLSVFVRSLLLFLLVIYILPGVAAGGSSSSDSHTQSLQTRGDGPLVLQLAWKHQFQFAGFYAAIEKGFYADRGLNIDVREYHRGLDVIDEVTSGRATFGFFNSRVISERLKGRPLVLLGNYFKINPLLVVGGEGVTSLEDLKGKSLMISRNDLDSPLFRRAFKAVGLVPGVNLDIVPHTFDPGPFLRGEVDAVTAYASNELYFFEQAGARFQVIPISEYLPSLGDGYLFSDRAEVDAHRRRTEAFIEATNEGWRYALAHPEEIIDLILAKYSNRKPRAALLDEAEKLRQLMLPVAFPIGAVYHSRIAEIADAIVELGDVRDTRHLKGFLFDELRKEGQGIVLTAEEKNWLRDHPVIKVAADPGWAPVEYITDDGLFAGISSDYLKLLGKVLGVRFDVATDMTWKEAAEAVNSGELDMFASIRQTPARSKQLVFTKTYLSMPIVVFTRAESPYIGDLGGLENKKVAVVDGYAIHELLAANPRGMQLVPVADIGKALLRLSGGEVDAFVGNMLTTGYYISKLGLANIKVAGETPYRNDQSMAVRKDKALFGGILQKALDAVPESRRNEIYRRWTSVTYEHGFDYAMLWKIAVFALLVLGVFLYWNSLLRKEVGLRRKAEASMREARDKAQAANASKSDFLANMSHELRTPLNAVLGFASLLRETPQSAQNRSYLEAVQTAGKSLLHLIDDILDLSKIEAGHIELKTELMNLRALLRELELMFGHKAVEKGLVLRFHVAQDLPSQVNLDEARLRQILLNLLGNAVKFTETGEISLDVSVHALDGGQLDLRIGVRDTGIGIPLEHQQAVFELFTQCFEPGKVKYGGTGLGLAISRKLAQLMNGNVLLESEVGKGSLFTLQLPRVRYQSRLAVDPDVSSANTLPSLRRADVLVVDDEELNRQLILRYLEPLGFTLRGVGDGQTALDAVAVRKPDLILMDIAMPVMDGLEATRRLRADRATALIPIVAVTAFATEDRAQLIKQACDGYIVKPISKAGLLEAIAPFVEQDSELLEATGGGAKFAEIPKPFRQKLRELCANHASINEFEAIAEEMQAIGAREQQAALEGIGRDLLRKAENFDIKAIHALVDGLVGR